MYQTRVHVQTNQILGNSNIMNPQHLKWMDKPPGDSSELGYLKPLGSLMVKQVASVVEMYTGIAAQSKFGVFNDRGEQVFYAFEESDVCERMCCTSTRAFILHVVDKGNQEIMRVRREFRCCAGFCNWFACCAACQQEVTVESPVGTVIGSVTQQCSFKRANYDLKDATGTVVLTILGPGCLCDGPMSCCCENKFTLHGTDDSEIGFIQKKYRGYVAEAMTSADQFTVQFPIDLDVRMKAVALGCIFLIDFAHFSEPPERRQQTRRRHHR